MTDETLTSPPDRLSLDPRSKFFDSKILERGIGVRFRDKERTNVIEYCISEGWVRVQAGRSNDRFGNPMTVKVKGPVEVWFEDLKANEDGGSTAESSAASDTANETAAQDSAQSASEEE